MAPLPLVHSAWLTAIAFSLANALVLKVRIRAENVALGYTCGDAAQSNPSVTALLVAFLAQATAHLITAGNRHAVHLDGCALFVKSPNCERVEK